MPMTDGQDVFACTPDDIDESGGMAELAFCTQDEDCKADVDGHQDDCPVEQRLREDFGF